MKNFPRTIIDCFTLEPSVKQDSSVHSTLICDNAGPQRGHSIVAMRIFKSLVLSQCTSVQSTSCEKYYLMEFWIKIISMFRFDLG